MNQSSDSINSGQTDSTSHDIRVPQILQNGTLMMKVSAKKTIRTRLFLNYDRGQITWESKKGGSLNIESIREIRFGQDASYYRSQFKIDPDYESVWMTIIYISKKSTYKMLHLFAIQAEAFQSWKDTLERILALRRELLGGLNHMRKRQAYWLKQNWSEANTITDSKLNFHETVELCRRLNISVPESNIKSNFNVADPEQKGYLDFAGFQQFVKLIKTRTDLDVIFQQITSGSKTMSEQDFVSFMQNVQCSPLPPASLRAIYSKFLDELAPSTLQSDSSTSAASNLMTIEGFHSFIQSSDNSAFNESHLRVCQDMTRPICDYFVSSSHNTYLVGNQLKGESTVEGYIRALQQGSRSVELDCWDGDAGEPVIYHGRTLTSKLLVADALQAISKYAFAASPYPLILSLEVHCQPAQQERLAALLKTHLGAALVDQRLDGLDTGNLPSPEQLMYRILIKAKKKFVGSRNPAKPTEITPESDLSVSSTTSSNTSGSSTSSDSDLKRIFTNASSRLGHRFKRISKVMSPQSSSNETYQIPTLELKIPPSTGPVLVSSLNSAQSIPPLTPSITKVPTAPLTNTLSDIVVYTVGVKARGFNKLTKYDPEHVLSLSERAVNKFLKGGQLTIMDLIGHTRGHLTRAYPAATRVFSGNFLPHRFWAAGIQLVACNWQTHDLGMELNQAFFGLNGRSGYVLKPEVLRIKPKEKDAATKLHKYELDISIISAQQLPRPSDNEVGPDACVELQVIAPIAGSSSHQIPSSMKRRTKVVKGNGLNPIFEERFQIRFDAPGAMLDLCFLRVLVCDDQLRKSGDDDGILGRICVCMEALQPGYRHLPLNDEAGQPLMFASLFMKSRVTKVNG